MTSWKSELSGGGSRSGLVMLWVCPGLVGMVFVHAKNAIHLRWAQFIMDPINLTAQAIVQASFRISQQLGHGMLESVYVRVLARDLERTGHRIEIQKPISFEFEGLH